MSVDNDLNLERLNEYLAAHLDGFQGPISTVKKFGDGQSNPTFLLESLGRRYVLRRKPPGKLLKSAHAVDREFRVMKALQETDVPVPRVYLLCTDDAVIGSWFYIMDYVAGRIFWDPALPEISRDERASLYDQMNRVLAAIARVDVEQAGLADYGKAGNYFARQISRWSRQYEASKTEPILAMDRLIAWLPEHIPPDEDKVSLIHGDFRLDNMIFHPTEPKILAVIDWELSTLGHPLADISYQCTQLRFPRDLILQGLQGLNRAALGIPDEATYLEAFTRRTTLDPQASWDFYLAFNCFRFAAITQGVLKRALDGIASSDYALKVGAMTKPVARMGWELIRSQGG
jgi:aminoglycoside phosphotransferase (APT) family kinase protein